jgi:hypothetical protein
MIIVAHTTFSILKQAGPPPPVEHESRHQTRQKHILDRPASHVWYLNTHPTMYSTVSTVNITGVLDMSSVGCEFHQLLQPFFKPPLQLTFCWIHLGSIPGCWTFESIKTFLILIFFSSATNWPGWTSTNNVTFAFLSAALFPATLNPINVKFGLGEHALI